MNMLGIEYISYHTCTNDCILYRGKYMDKDIYVQHVGMTCTGSLKKKG